jgi:hypothetical protein
VCAEIPDLSSASVYEWLRFLRGEIQHPTQRRQEARNARGRGRLSAAPCGSYEPPTVRKRGPQRCSGCGWLRGQHSPEAVASSTRRRLRRMLGVPDSIVARVEEALAAGRPLTLTAPETVELAAALGIDDPRQIHEPVERPWLLDLGTPLDGAQTYPVPEA